MKTKICSKCKKEKELDQFNKSKATKDNYCYKCKKCCNEYSNIWAKNNYDQIKETTQRWIKNNPDRVKENNKRWIEENYERAKELWALNNQNNKEYINKKSLEYYYNNKKHCSNMMKLWNSNNKSHTNLYSKKYIKERCLVDPVFNLRRNINIKVNRCLKENGYSKKSRTYEILGCSFEEFKQYLESKFEPWMTWENKGLYNGNFNYGWDIDHIIPISTANTEEEILKLSHFSNLQPLCSKVNRDIKKDKLDYEY